MKALLLWLCIAFTCNAEITTQTVPTSPNATHDWVHPRIGRFPDGQYIMTSQKTYWLANDVFYGIGYTFFKDVKKAIAPTKVDSALKNTVSKNGVERSFSDAWPAYHAKSGKMLLIGHSVYYKNLTLLPAKTRPRETLYSVFDRAKKTWSKPAVLKMPVGFEQAGAGSVQRYDLPNGDILLPIYYRDKKSGFYRIVVATCGFNGKVMVVKKLGASMGLANGRGIVEPSIIYHGGKYWITIRNDSTAYYANSNDGLSWSTLRQWRFSDTGEVINSYNTQSHFAVIYSKLFLIYTRSNDFGKDVPRDRSPLFMAKIDTKTGLIDAASEVVVMPYSKAKFGNFGVVSDGHGSVIISDSEWRYVGGVDTNNIYLTTVN